MLVGNILAVSWPEVGKTAAALRRGRAVSLHLPPQVPGDLDGPEGGRSARASRSGSGISCSTRRSASSSPRRSSIAGVLLVFCYLIVPSVAAMLYADTHRPPPGDRLDDGDGRVGAGRVSVAAARSADRRDDRLHVRPGADRHGDRAPAHSANVVHRAGHCGIEIADKALICYRCGTATTEAKFKPAAPKRRSSSSARRERHRAGAAADGGALRRADGRRETPRLLGRLASRSPWPASRSLRTRVRVRR